MDSKDKVQTAASSEANNKKRKTISEGPPPKAQPTEPKSSIIDTVPPPHKKPKMLFQDSDSDEEAGNAKATKLLQAQTPEPKQQPHVPSSKPPNAFQFMMAASAKAQPSTTKPQSSIPKSTSHTSNAVGSWSNALGPYVQTPEKFPDVVYFASSKVVAILDKYPKAKQHLLVMPRKIVDGYKELSKADIGMLRELKIVGERIAKELKQKDPSLTFNIGFHAIPSMRQLHMHVISTDMQSEHLKSKKHWNSFTTEFFIDVDAFINILSTSGVVKFDTSHYENILKRGMTCNRCGDEFNQIPKLKSHIENCTKRKTD